MRHAAEKQQQQQPKLKQQKKEWRIAFVVEYAP